MGLRDQKVVVVGGSSGFGLEVARMALAEGAAVVIGGRSQDRLDKALKILSAVSSQVSGEIVDAASVESLCSFFAKVGEYDHLVSTVGGAMGGGFLQADVQQIRSAMEEKFFHNLQLAQIGSEKIRAVGSITFTGGTGGRPHTASGAYLGNAGILTLAESLASELAPRVRVNVVAPTWTVTPFWDKITAEEREGIRSYFNQTVPLGRTAEIEEVASTYVFLMKNGFINGQQIAVDGGVMLRM